MFRLPFYWYRCHSVYRTGHAAHLYIAVSLTTQLCSLFHSLTKWQQNTNNIRNNYSHQQIIASTKMLVSFCYITVSVWHNTVILADALAIQLCNKIPVTFSILSIMLRVYSRVIALKSRPQHTELPYHSYRTYTTSVSACVYHPALMPHTLCTLSKGSVEFLMVQ